MTISNKFIVSGAIPQPAGLKDSLEASSEPDFTKLWLQAVNIQE